MNYLEALAYLNQLTKFGINLGLSRMERLLAIWGNPHQQLACVHVGGTNGKGSVCAMVSSILQAAGFKVGMFTSPHLESYTERFQINGEAIPEAEVAQLITELRPHLEQMVAEGFEHPTEFEVNTALAFQYFHRAGVDLAVIEVGMGGDLDSTNLITPSVSIITNVSLEHEQVLGHSLRDIARTKAGIIKPKVPLVTATEGEAWSVLRRVASQLAAPVIRILPGPPAQNEFAPSYRTVWLNSNQSRISRLPQPAAVQVMKGQTLSVRGLEREYRGLWIPLLGEHQKINATVAIAAIEVLREQGLRISDADIYQGLQKTIWPGRLELVSQNPLIILDGAHNPAGARCLASFVGESFPDHRLILVIGVLEDKNRDLIVQAIAPLANEIIVTEPPGPRSGNWTEVARLAERYTDRVIIQDRLPDALASGVELVQKYQHNGQAALLCVTGSLYLIAEARRILKCQERENI